MSVLDLQILTSVFNESAEVGTQPMLGGESNLSLILCDGLPTSSR